jgi:transposase
MAAVCSSFAVAVVISSNVCGTTARGMCLFSKRLERGRFLWPSTADGTVTISTAQLGYLLEGIDWRMPQKTWRPTAAG